MMYNYYIQYSNTCIIVNCIIQTFANFSCHGIRYMYACRRLQLINGPNVVQPLSSTYLIIYALTSQQVVYCLLCCLYQHCIMDICKRVVECFVRILLLQISG